MAVLLLGLTLLLFGWLQGDLARLWCRLRPLPGLAITAALSLPWYGLALAVEGEPFWRSFFGYHNLQRFTAVVNNHLQPWWFFGPVLLLASLPWSPVLLLGLLQGLGARRPGAGAGSGGAAAAGAVAAALQRLLAAGGAAVLHPGGHQAAQLLVAGHASGRGAGRPGGPAGPGDALGWGWVAATTVLLSLVMALVFAAAPLWLPLVITPEMPSLPQELLDSRLLALAAGCYGVAALGGALLWWRRQPLLGLAALQVPLLLFVPLVLLPSWQLGDRLRGLPVRAMAGPWGTHQTPAQPLAMVGMLKPSLHYYSRRVVIYEGAPASGLVNLADRLAPGAPPGSGAEWGRAAAHAAAGDRCRHGRAAPLARSAARGAGLRRDLSALAPGSPAPGAPCRAAACRRPGARLAGPAARALLSAVPAGLSART